MAKQSNAASVIRFDYHLDELFDSVQLRDLMDVARQIVVKAFIMATEPTPTSRIKMTNMRSSSEVEFWVARNPRRSTDNYIIGVGGKQKDLATHVLRHARRPIVRESDLPRELRHSKKDVQRIISSANHRIVAALLNEMCSAPLCEIWYEKDCGLWQIIQSSVDGYKQAIRKARAALKFDRRNEHGMVRSQRINRGRPAGVSTSIAKSTAHL